MFCINERYGLLYLLQGGLQLVRRELILVHPPVVPCVQPEVGDNPLSGTLGHSQYLPVEGLVVFKVLAQSLQEESELPELDEVRTVFTGSFGHIFYVVETSVDGGDGIKQFIHCDDVTDSLKCVINIYFN